MTEFQLNKAAFFERDAPSSHSNLEKRRKMMIKDTFKIQIRFGLLLLMFMNGLFLI